MNNYLLKNMAMELDPQFIKALRLLRSKSKDSGAQLKAMLDEAIRLKKGLSTGLSNLFFVFNQLFSEGNTHRVLKWA